MATAIDMRDVEVRAHHAEILRGITLRVEAGEFLAVLGPNGAGKTTLLQTLPRLVRFRGDCTVLGENVRRLGGLALTRLRRRLGYVPQMVQRPAPVLPLRVAEVIELGRCGVRGSGGALDERDREVCRRVMEETDLLPLADRPFTVLSGGEQRKAHLARALAQEPEILLLDEPAGHLDFRWQEQITELLGRVWRQHRMTVLMVTHDLRHLPAGITRVALMKRGQLLQVGEPQAVLSDAVLSELYDLRLRVVRLGERYVAVPEVAQ
jgi:iron complex transport system ATP-binding protein